MLCKVSAIIAENMWLNQSEPTPTGNEFPERYLALSNLPQYLGARISDPPPGERWIRRPGPGIEFMPLSPPKLIYGALIGQGLINWAADRINITLLVTEYLPWKYFEFWKRKSWPFLAYVLYVPFTYKIISKGKDILYQSNPGVAPLCCMIFYHQSGICKQYSIPVLCI